MCRTVFFFFKADISIAPCNESQFLVQFVSLYQAAVSCSWSHLPNSIGLNWFVKGIMWFGEGGSKVVWCGSGDNWGNEWDAYMRGKWFVAALCEASKPCAFRICCKSSLWRWQGIKKDLHAIHNPLDYKWQWARYINGYKEAHHYNSHFQKHQKL